MTIGYSDVKNEKFQSKHKYVIVFKLAFHKINCPLDTYPYILY